MNLEQFLVRPHKINIKLFKENLKQALYFLSEIKFKSSLKTSDNPYYHDIDDF